MPEALNETVSLVNFGLKVYFVYAAVVVALVFSLFGFTLYRLVNHPRNRN